MTRRAGGLLLAIAMTVAGFFAGMLLEKRIRSVEAQGKSNFSAAAIAGEKNTQDVWGPYEVVPDWPKPITSLPGTRKVDLGSGGERLRGERQSRFHPGARRNSRDEAPRRSSLPQSWPQHLLSCFPASFS